MSKDNMSFEKKALAITYVFLFVAFVSTAVVMEQVVGLNSFGTDVQSFSGGVPVEYNQLGEVYSSVPTKLKAIVKGSIYETGSNMTVFGACFDGDSFLFPEANATFTAWYPNGTLHTGPNATMFTINDDFQGNFPNGTGRWGIHVTMTDTIGTYLTEMRCEFDGEWAVAFGEWQNPEWVQRIGDTQDLLINVSQDIADFRNETQINFDNLEGNITQIINISISGDLSALDQDLIELRSAVQDIDANRWRLDETNPFFTLASGNHEWTAIDMLHEDDVIIASSDGYIATWDGESWTEALLAGFEWRGVSVVPANLAFAWIAGTNGTTPFYSINGANATEFVPPSGTPTALNDIKIFQNPLNPSGSFLGYTIGDDGTVYSTSNTGIDWVTAFSMGANGNASKGRISQVVENYDVFGQVDGYMAMFGQGERIVISDGVTEQATSVVGQVKDVSMLYFDLGYAIVEDEVSNSTKIYKFDGTNITLDFTIEDPNIVPTGVVALARNDVWITTSDPSTFFHFDGRNWEYGTVGYSQFVSVLISFGGGNGSVGIQDLAMSDTKHGYAVGGDGLILIYGQHYDVLFAELFAILDAQDGNLTLIQELINSTNSSLSNLIISINNSLSTEITNLGINLTDLILDVNQSIINEFITVNGNLTVINDFLINMNESLTGDLVDISNNITQIQNDIINISIDLDSILGNISSMQSFLDSMNSSIHNELDDIDNFLTQMNTTINFKLDNILNNVTFTQLWLNTTLYPLTLSIFDNTVTILTNIGILQESVNQTIILQNQTLSIVNNTDANVEILLNRSNRIRAWVTQ